VDPYRLEILGEPRLLAPEGELADLPPGKRLALLAYVALSSEPPSRDRLASVFWSRSPPERARASVRQALWLLRNTLGEEVFSSLDPIRLDRGRLVTDAEELESLLAAGDVDRALDLWRGPPFEDFGLPNCPEWDHWVDGLRVRVGRRMVRVLETTANRLVDEGESGGAARLLDRAVGVAPYSGELHRLRVEVFLQRHELDRAEEALEEAGQALRDLPAFSAFRPLEERIAQLKRQSFGEGPREMLEPDFVGRTREFAALTSLVRRAGESRGGPGLILGRPGIGKTRLAREVNAFAATQGFQVAFVQALETERSLRWSVVAEVVRTLIGMPGAAGISNASDQQLRSLLPSSLGNGTTRGEAIAGGASAAELLQGPVNEAALADAFHDLVGAVAQEDPLILCVDDLQWADPQSRALLSQAARKLASEPCMFLFTCRTGEGDPGVARTVIVLSETPAGWAGELAPLTRLELAELLEMRTSFDPASEAPGFIDRLHEVSGGNPLFVVEVLRAFHQEGRLEVNEDGGWNLSLSGLGGQLPLPDSVDGLIQRRLLALGEDAVLVSVHLADEGIPLSPAALGARTGLSAAALNAAVTSLLERDVVGWSDREHLAFTHDEIRTAVLARFRSILPGVRRRRRRRWFAGIASFAFSLVLLWSLQRGGLDWLPWGATPPAYGGGSILIRSGSDLLELLPPGASFPSPLISQPYVSPVDIGQATDPGGWRLWRLGLPDGLDLRPPGPFRDSNNGFSWYGLKTDPEEAPHVVRRYPDGREEEILRTPGDDGVVGINPSGSHLLLLSQNLRSREYNRNLLITRADGSGARFLRGSTGLMRDGDWSPDGRRILTVVSADQDSLIVIRPGGGVVSSLEVDDPSMPRWCGGSSRIILARRVGSEMRLSIFDVDTGEISDLVVAEALPLGFACSPDGNAVVYSAIREGGVTLMVQDLQSGEAERIPVDLPPPATVLTWLAPTPPVGIDSVVIRSPGEPLPVDWGLSQKLGAEVFYSDGRWGYDNEPVSWKSLDPSVAVVDPAGRVVGTGLGRTAVIASVDDWIEDTVQVIVSGDGGREVLLQDEFSSLEAERWALVGIPTPRAVVEGDRPALEMPGDGRYQDGILTAEALDLGRGATVELEFRMRLTRRDRQRLMLCLIQDINASPTRQGEFLFYEDYQGRQQACVKYPFGEQYRLRDDAVEFSAAFLSAMRVEVPDIFPSESWVQMALQVRSDGQIQAVVDRRVAGTFPVHLSDIDQGAWSLVLIGAAVDTRLLVRNLVVWRGLRYGPEGPLAPEVADGSTAPPRRSDPPGGPRASEPAS
jgi:DNA-binding SARP family transcriptional activator